MANVSIFRYNMLRQELKRYSYVFLSNWYWTSADALTVLWCIIWFQHAKCSHAHKIEFSVKEKAQSKTMGVVSLKK